MVRVEIFKQSDGYCGPTSLRMSVDYYDIKTTEEECVRMIGALRRTGCGGERILGAGKKFGLEYSQLIDNCSKEVLRELCKHFPVIVNYTLPVIGEDGKPFVQGHYSVAEEVTKRKIYLAEPRSGTEIDMLIGDFMGLWYDFKNLHPKKKEDFILRRAIAISNQDLYEILKDIK